MTYPTDEIALPPACTTMGTGESGDRCADGIVCHSGRCSRAVGSVNCGTCLPTAGAGKTCADTAECDAGLRCVQGAQAKTCAKPLALGQPCTTNNACAGQAGCVGGICTRWALKGEKCDQNGQTAAFCSPNLYLGCDRGTCAEVFFYPLGGPAFPRPPFLRSPPALPWPVR